jgi:transcriptional regulator with GAF, ATPase, and Fis domain
MGIHSPFRDREGDFLFLANAFLGRYAAKKKEHLMKGKPNFLRHFDAKIYKYILNINELRKNVNGQK